MASQTLDVRAFEMQAFQMSTKTIPFLGDLKEALLAMHIGGAKEPGIWSPNHRQTHWTV